MNDTYKTFDEITAEDIKNILAIDVERDKSWGLPIIRIDDNSYAVAASEEEANQAVAEHIKSYICYFRPSFIAEHSDIPVEIFEALAEKDFDKPDVYLQLIHDFDDFVNDAIDADGRGHFLNIWDGEEYEIDNYLLYRTV